MSIRDETIKKLVDEFLAWPLPQDVCADLCATDPHYKHSRSGTMLLTAEQARKMFEHLWPQIRIYAFRFAHERIDPLATEILSLRKSLELDNKRFAELAQETTTAIAAARTEERG